MGEQMLKFCSLYSGSTGNSLFVENNNTKILIDAGVSGKKVVEALDSIDVKGLIEDIKNDKKSTGSFKETV